MNNEPIAPAGAPVEPTPTEPTPVTPESAAPQTDPVAFTPDPVVYPAEKKSKIPLIIGAIVGVLVIAAAAFGIFWYVNYTKPETVALDAMSKLLGTKTTDISGQLTVNIPDNDYGLETIKLEFRDANSLIPATSAGTLTFATAQDEFSVSLGSVIVEDGTVYFKAEGIVEMLDSAIPADLAPFVDLFEAELDEFDGQWYEVDAVEIAAIFGATVTDTDYTCFVDAYKHFGSDSSLAAMVDGYKENPFVTLEKTDQSVDGATGYTVSISDADTDAFLEHIYDNTTVFEPFWACLDDIGATETGAILDRFSSADLPALTLFVTDWGHEPTALKASYQSEYYAYSATLNFSYPDSITVTTPEDSKPFSDFLDGIVTKFNDIISGESTGETV